jgi:CBS domain-containing protein
MRVQDLMSHPAITCYVTDSLNVPAKLMWDHDCGAIPVVDEEGKLAGMVTDRDIGMAAYTQGRPLAEIVVSDVMARHVISAEPDQELGEVEHLMSAHQVRRIPIVDAHGKPVGLLSLNDLAIESAQADTRMQGGASRVAHTLAAICQRRGRSRRAA